MNRKTNAVSRSQAARDSLAFKALMSIGEPLPRPERLFRAQLRRRLLGLDELKLLHSEEDSPRRAA